MNLTRLGRWRTQTAAGGVAVAGLFVAIAATLASSRGTADGSPGLRPILQVPDAVVVLVVVCVAFAALLMLVRMVPRGFRRRRKDDIELEIYYEPPHVSPWGLILLLAFLLGTLAAVGYALWHGWIPVDAGTLRGAGPRLGDAAPAPPPPRAPVGADKPAAELPAFNTAAVVVVLVAGLGSLALTLWIYVGDRVALWWARPWTGARPWVSEAVAESLEDLRTLPDARVAIIRCYRRFEHALAGVRFGRAPWETPGEFMRAALRRLSLPAAAVAELTELFEVARFSKRPLGPADREAAWQALSEIKVALEREPSDVEAA